MVVDAVFIGVITANIIGIAEIGATVITAMMSGACLSTCCGGKGFGFQHTDTDTAQLQATQSECAHMPSRSSGIVPIHPIPSSSRSSPARFDSRFLAPNRSHAEPPSMQVHSPRHGELKRSHSESSL